jgi:FAD/FMN-containing dehydrogenase
VTEFSRQVVELDAGCSLQCHAGDGVTIIRFAEFPADGLARSLLARLAPLASRSRGNVTILSNASGAEMTHQSVWGGIDAPFDLMTAVKREFDPRNLLNPGRFVYT